MLSGHPARQVPARNRPHNEGNNVISDSNPTPCGDSEDISASAEELADRGGADDAGDGVALTTDDTAQRDDEQPIKTDNA